MLLVLKTPKQGVVDITEEVQQEIARSGVMDGLCALFVQHTSAALFVNENDEKIPEDLFDVLERLIPEQPAVAYRHADGNAHAHLKASIIGPSLVVPVAKGRLALGTWQRVLLVEFDGPRQRNVSVTLINAAS
ncbi:YjbQ family protein [Candidatus Woesearchaeota archaeon]|nr:MAG: YjbQ family protein [Candidatus Woesearchaeota archaeon]